jgi:putative transcriptional regulator
MQGDRPEEMPDAHISPDLLLRYAAGTLPDGMNLLAASHLTFCPRCRGRVARLELLCGVLVAGARASDLAAPDVRRVLARIDRDEILGPPPCAAGRCGAALPLPLRRRLGAGALGLHWRLRAPGLSEHRLGGFPGEDVRLLRARPGTRIPVHAHSGQEATLVLAGAMRDGSRIYRRGDVSLAAEGHAHGAEIVGAAECICLEVLSLGRGAAGRSGGPGPN